MSASEAIRLARPSDLDAVGAALAALARDLGDPYRIPPEGLSAALFGPRAFAFALLAGARGVLVAQPLLSTMTGGPLVFVSDLWVDGAARGTGLGRRMLAEAGREGRARWGAVGMKLTVYAGNDGALGFYRRLGFDIRTAERGAILSPASFAALASEAA